MSNSDQPKPVISAILEKTEGGKRMIFVQTRWKPQVSPNYSGMLEIPAGVIDGYENVFDTLSREVREETGLEIVKVLDSYQGEVTENRPPDKAQIFQPYICQQALETNGGLPWIGFVFRCEVKGEIRMQQEEAKDPRWITVEELKEILTNKPETIFPLQYPVLKYYVEKNVNRE